jgi:hypothetical protein
LKIPPPKQKKEEVSFNKDFNISTNNRISVESSGSYQGTMVLDFDYECDTL